MCETGQTPFTPWRYGLTIDRDLLAAVAVTRLGLGARSGEIAAARGDPRGWALAQIREEGADQPTPAGAGAPRRFGELRQLQIDRRDARLSGQSRDDAVKTAARILRQEVGADFLDRLRLAAGTEAGFRERWALFWANHFTVSAAKAAVAGLVGPFERDAIRPHVFGRFEDMLVASSQHPAMLIYLDQARSIGPDSMASRFQARNGKTVGLNENLAREIMELHTVGLAASYSQSDVTEFARAMTGWSIGAFNDPQGRAGEFMFRPRAHEPGARTVMGRRYDQDGIGQARAVLRDLAANPNTARHLATKIARHFVSDDPPSSLVARLEQSWRESDGRLDKVASALINAPETWDPTPAKFKTPYEFLVSSWRAAGTVPDDVRPLAQTLTAMGQKPLGAPSPKGWAETTGDWCAPDAIIKRMDWSEAFAAGVIGDRDPAQLAADALGARLTPLAAKTIARAETRAEGLSILLMSPEFQRR